MSRAFVIHGWGSNPSGDWFPWIKTELERRGYTVFVPEMPDSDNPEIESWLETIKNVVGELRENDIFIGHSIGCQAILRFLQLLSVESVVSKVILVAPWLTVTNLDADSQKTADKWTNSPIDFSQIISKTKLMVTIFSDNDPWVPLAENTKLFQENLNPKILILKKKFHFSLEDGISQVPEILDFI